ncbi:MAG: hypothetical protein Q8Q06_03355 [bacterium]|nr:hypothetical protein [bacterium]
MKFKFGFSTGCLYKIEPSIREALKIFRSLSYNSVELNMMQPQELFKNIGSITAEDLKGFDYVSMHAPKMKYGKNRESWDIFNRISYFSRTVRRLDLVVFHPNTVDDFSIFHDTGFRVGFENLDNRIRGFNTPDEMYDLLLKNPNWKMVFDLNHIFTVDGHVLRVPEFCTKLWNKIRQVHLSGYSEEIIHAPLFKTKQDDIIRAVGYFDNTTIIMESVMESLDELEKERKYVEDILNGP